MEEGRGKLPNKIPIAAAAAAASALDDEEEEEDECDVAVPAFALSDQADLLFLRRFLVSVDRLCMPRLGTAPFMVKENTPTFSQAPPPTTTTTKKNNFNCLSDFDWLNF